MSAKKVAINGLGRIGRAVARAIIDDGDFDLIAVNDLVSAENLAYLLRYDSVYGQSRTTVAADDGRLIVGNRKVQVLNEKDPANLPWRDLDIDVVFECTGAFTTADGLRKHIQAGAKKAILSAPASGGEEIATVVHGVNGESADVDMISCASCTTNCITPVIEVLHRHLGVVKATMTTIHAYTSTQAIVDAPAKKWRRGRAAAINLVPTSTGAAKATTKVLTELNGRFDGVAVRAPVPVGSISDIVAVTSRQTSVAEVNGIFRREAVSERYTDILGITDDPIVSSDIVGDRRAAIVDLTMTQVVAGDLVKLMAWYDNESGYANQMVRHAKAMHYAPAA